MKHLEKEFSTFLSIIFLILTVSAKAQNSTPADRAETVNPMDSVEVSLLTCSPHEEIYSLYGHSALRWHDLRENTDLTFNWGIFNFNKPFFVARFVFGLTDYELGALPYDRFLQEYQQVGSSVTEQVLNLTAQEKAHLFEALKENLMPENRIYRYNYFYDNCSTRPRDIVERCIDGKVEYAVREDYAPTYREMVHACVRNHPWAAFGNDMLLGVRSDLQTNMREQEFLPENLLYDFDRAKIYSNGEYRPLVKERRMAVPPGVQIIERDFIFTPMECAVILLIVSLLILVYEWKKKKTVVFWDGLLMLIQGLAGCVLFVMLFSQHPTTSTNLQVLLLNPLPLFFIPAIIRRRQTRWWSILAIMIILFLIGSIFQQYAEGMMIVALCLLLRVLIHIKLKA